MDVIRSLRSIRQRLRLANPLHKLHKTLYMEAPPMPFLVGNNSSCRRQTPPHPICRFYTNRFFRPNLFAKEYLTLKSPLFPELPTLPLQFRKIFNYQR